MLQIHPIVRLFGAVLIVIAVFFTADLRALIFVYALVMCIVIATGVLARHFRFLIFITTPILLALLVVWGWVMDPAKIPAPHTDGLAYAVFNWLRIVACGGVLQSLFLPLVDKPQHLRSFLWSTGLRGPAGTVLVASIIFVPEVKSRLARIIDARRAQGYNLSGIHGLRQLPSLLMPLVSSLLDSATKRAELWSHRGIVDRYNQSFTQSTHKPLASLAAVIMAVIALVIGTYR